jgi:hypothetical protein
MDCYISNLAALHEGLTGLMAGKEPVAMAILPSSHRKSIHNFQDWPLATHNINDISQAPCSKVTK